MTVNDDENEPTEYFVFRATPAVSSVVVLGIGEVTVNVVDDDGKEHNIFYAHIFNKS